jgi:heat shock protein HtpX
MNDSTWQQHALINRLQTLLLLVVMVAFLALLGALLWGSDGVIILITLGLLLFLFTPNISPKLIMRMYRASPLFAQRAPFLHAALQALSQRAGLHDMPVLYYIPSGMVNAFAVGSRNDAAIGITDGFLRKLGREEIIAVLAHEVSHIRSNDMRVMGLADLFSRLTSLLSLTGQLLLLINLPLLLFAATPINWFAIAILILAPNVSALAQLGLSRTREYNADLNAVQLTGDPRALASALLKIEQLQGSWIERLILPGRKIPEPSLLRTHPPTEERVRRLLSLQKPDGGAYHDHLHQQPHYMQDKPIQRRPGWHLNGLWY